MADHAADTAPLDREIGRLLATRERLTFVQVLGVQDDPLRDHIAAGRLEGVIATASPERAAQQRDRHAGNSAIMVAHCTVATAPGHQRTWRRRSPGEPRPAVVGGTEDADVLTRLAEPIDVMRRTIAGLLHEHDLRTLDLLSVEADVASLLSAGGLAHGRPGLVLFRHADLPAHEHAATTAFLTAETYRLLRLPNHTLAVRAPVAAGHRETLLRVAAETAGAGRSDDAQRLLEHLVGLDPGDRDALRALAAIQSEAGCPLEALATLRALAAAGEPIAALATAPSQAAIAAFNAAREVGDLATAELHAAALAELFPENAALLEAAFGCNRALGWDRRTLRFAGALLRQDPAHPAANAVLAEHHAAAGNRPGEAWHRARLALGADAMDPLRRLYALHAALSLLLLDPLSAPGWTLAGELAEAARGIDPALLPEPQQRDWAWHYRLLAEAADPALLAGEPADLALEAFVDSAGTTLDAPALARLAKAEAAEVVFLVAADERYLRLYGRLFARSVLAACEMPCLLVLHVIGGAERLAEIARATGIDDRRVVFSADDFAPGSVACVCRDSDGPATLPLAHLQSARFLVAAPLLRLLRLPLFVSDIDMLLQRGVAALLQRFRDADIVLNRNEDSPAFGSRLTANLALFQPTAPAAAFLDTLGRHLTASLRRPAVTRWIDQCALQFAWQHLTRAEPAATVAWFDTDADVNNVMYRRYQSNPFCFLSLYHGFDLDSLPAELSGHA